VTLASLFHPAVAAWFERNFEAPTAALAAALDTNPRRATSAR